jgi:putative ABC transport system permease protein
MFQDLRFSFRQLAASPGFAAVAILTLAIAIGANTAIFSAVDAVLLHPLPYPDPGRLVIVQETLPQVALRNIPPSPQDFAEFRRVQTSFTAIAGAQSTTATLTADGAPEDVPALKITASLFPMLGVIPIAGGLFTTDDEQTGRDRVAIISEGLWTRRYGRDPGIVGRNIYIDREPYRVAGVIRPILDYRVTADLWMPLSFKPAEIQPGTRGPHYIDVIGRLKPSVSIEQARVEFRAIASRIVEQYPNQASLDHNFSIDVFPLAERQAGDLKTPLLVLIASVGALLLIACANVSNLLLARSMTRRREVAVRAALGAGRWRIVRQLLTESLLLGLTAGVMGTSLAFFALHRYGRFAPEGLIHGPQPALNVWVMAFSILVSIAASVVFGLAPAVETSRIDLAEALKEGARGATTARRVLRESMVALEVGISLVLLIGAGLTVESFVHLVRTSPGFRPENVLAAMVSLPATDYPEPARRAAFIDALLERARTLPQVRSAAVVDFIPYYGGPGSQVDVVGHPRDPHAPTQVVYQTRTSPGFFETLGIPLLRGRDFRPSDEQGSPPVAIIDETVAHRFFPDRDPLGERLRLPFTRTDYTIIGIAAATKSGSLSAPPLPRAYYFGPQVPFPSVALLIRTTTDPLALTNAVRHEIATLDPNLPVTALTMEQILADSVARQRFAIELMTALASIAAFLAGIGIYGVLAYLVDQRRREFGIRIALGARSVDVLALVLRQGAIPVATGLAAGIAAAFALTRLLKTLLYETSPADPSIFAAVSLFLMLIALLAMTLPARRATQADPLAALRHE